MDDARPESRIPPDLWFLGGLDDPWVREIADALPATSRRVDCPGELPESAFEPASLAANPVVVLHRPGLNRQDVERLKRFRGLRTPAPRVVLCYGPYVRYDDLVRWGDLFDVALPEATAQYTVARHLSGDPTPSRRVDLKPSATRFSIVSSNFALLQMLVDACEGSGYTVSAARDWSSTLPAGPAIWDVPVLEPSWPAEMAERSKSGPLVALIGFPDRSLVTEARAHGASICLELPLDLVDLAAALERVCALWRNSPQPQPAHKLPPAPAVRRLASKKRAVAERRSEP